MLELARGPGLTPPGVAKAQALLDGMFAASTPKGRRLEAVFAAGGADEARVRAAVVDVERLRAELRLIHRLTHLETRER